MPTLNHSDFDTQSLRVLEAAESALPEGKVRDAISAIREASNGSTAVVLAATEEFSTTEAASILGISRPHLYKILDSGALPFKTVGKNTRRVSGEDLYRYLDEFAAARKFAAQAVFDGQRLEDRALNDM